MIWLLACVEGPKGADADVDADSGWHVLVTGQMVLANSDALGVYETDEAGETVWSADLPDGAGGFGAVRDPNGDTLLTWARVQPSLSSGVWRLDAEGAVLNEYDDGDASPAVFPHGLALFANGDVLVADAFSGLLQRIDEDGDQVWSFSSETDDQAQAPTAARIFDVDGRPLLVATLLGDGSQAEPADQVIAWWVDGASPVRAWSYPPTPDPSLCLWVHGPQRLDDGTFLVSAAGLGQVIHLDADGTEIERTPSFESEYRFAFPRDAVLLPDGDMLVMDATELLRVTDPFGADFAVTEATELLFGYSIDVLDCARGGCSPTPG